jgi:hypothetical protein
MNAMQRKSRISIVPPTGSHSIGGACLMRLAPKSTSSASFLPDLHSCRHPL